MKQDAILEKSLAPNPAIVHDSGYEQSKTSWNFKTLCGLPLKSSSSGHYSSFAAARLSYGEEFIRAPLVDVSLDGCLLLSSSH